MSHELDEFRIELGKRTNSGTLARGLTKIIFDLPLQYPLQFTHSLTTILVKETTEYWMEKYGQLKLYVEENGNANVPQDESRLGGWVSRQRESYKNGTLLTERTDLLNEINFIWDVLDYNWQNKYEELKKYVIEHGSANIPKNHPTLGIWVNNLRRLKTKNELDKERIKCLIDSDLYGIQKILHGTKNTSI